MLMLKNFMILVTKRRAGKKNEPQKYDIEQKIEGLIELEPLQKDYLKLQTNLKEKNYEKK